MDTCIVGRRNEDMNEKIDSLRNMQYNGDIQFLMETIAEANKKKDTPQLQEMTKAITRVYFYVHNLLEERKCYLKGLSEYREDKNRAIERARASDKKVEELEEQLKKVNIFNQ